MKILALGNDSSELTREPNRLRMTSIRNSLVVCEGVFETSGTLKIQLYFLAMVYSIHQGFYHFLSLCIPKDKFLDVVKLTGVDDVGIFSLDWKVSVRRSIFAGLLSFTLAQYKLGIGTKHQTDASVSAKSTYFFACLINTLAIVTTESAYLFLIASTTFEFLAVMGYVRLRVAAYFLHTLNPRVEDVLFMTITMFIANRFPTYVVSFLIRRPFEKCLFRTRRSCFVGERGGYHIFGWGRPEFYWFLPAAQPEATTSGAEDCQEYNHFQRGGRSRLLYRCVVIPVIFLSTPAQPGRLRRERFLAPADCDLRSTSSSSSPCTATWSWLLSSLSTSPTGTSDGRNSIP